MMVATINWLDRATPELRLQLAQLSDLTPLNQRIGKREEVLLKDHFKELQSRGNKQKFPDVGFWYGTNGMAQHTHLTRADREGSQVDIADQRMWGKMPPRRPIYPKRGQFLARPLRAEAYEKSGMGRIRDVFPGLKFDVLPGIGPALVEAEASTIKLGRKRKDGTRKVTFTGQVGGLAFYQLLRESHTSPQEDALPTEDEIVETAIHTAQNYLDRSKKQEATQ